MSAQNGKRVVLAVDDVAVNLQIIRSLLSKDFDVRVAKSSELALSILSKLTVDLILMDIEMPEASGFECIEQAKARDLLGSSAVIFVTSHSSNEIIETAKSLGGFDCLGKPIDEKKMADAIFKALNIPESDAKKMHIWPK